MKIALVQINSIVGDLNYNARQIQKNIQKLSEQNIDLAIFPELLVTGYPPKDLLLKNDFLKAVEEIAYKEIAPYSKEMGILLGMPWRTHKGLSNAAVLFYDGRISGICSKTLLPNYDVFDECRYFVEATERQCIEFKGMKLGITVCEDMWNDEDYWNGMYYEIDPVIELVNQEAEIIINISASPYYFGKYKSRLEMMAHTAKKYGLNMVYVNQVGGNDDIVFDGSSCVLGNDGSLCYSLASFKEDFLVFDTKDLPHCRGKKIADLREGIEWIYNALVFGIKEYFVKNGFSKAIVGLSGGIDSSVTAALAVSALGKDNVTAVAMPSRYSSLESLEDSEKLANNLELDCRVIPIEKMFSAYLEKLNTGGDKVMDLAEENVQARIRGNILMYISNREGHLVLATGNKSETAVGYSTLYGDMCGGLSVLADVFKITVYKLAGYINLENEIIPHNVINKPPSAELSPGQLDEYTLPPYDILDDILKAYVEDNKSEQEIVRMGYDKELVGSVIRKLFAAEYKRRQAPLGIKITSKAFGDGNRLPITQKWSKKY